MSKKKKQVKTCLNAPAKEVKIQPASIAGKPVFRFEILDRNGDYAFDLNRKDFNEHDFLEKMIAYSRMAWTDIDQQTHDKGKSKHHYLTPYERLSKEARARLAQMQLDDFSDSIFSFAFTNLTRIIGIRIDDIFYVLWYDAHHEVYPTSK